MLDAWDPLPKMLDEDSMWEEDIDQNDKPSCEKPSRATLAWCRTMWACTKIAKVISGFHWDGKSTWWIARMLAEKARQWEEEDCLAHEEEECRKMGWRWVDLEGDQLMDAEDKVADTLSESRSKDNEDDSDIRR